MYYSNDKNNDKYDEYHNDIRNIIKEERAFNNLINHGINTPDETSEYDHLEYIFTSGLVITSAYFGFITFILRNAGMYIRLPFPTTFVLIILSIAWGIFSLVNKDEAFKYYEKFFKYSLPLLLLVFIVGFPIIFVYILSIIQDILFR